MLDVLVKAGFKIDSNDLRLWLYNSDENEEKSASLEDRCRHVKDGFLTAIQADDDKVETNSGVDFPSSSHV